MAVVDLDEDGHMDLVSANSDGGNLAIFYQDASGAFAPPVFLGGPPAMLGAS